MTHIKVSGNSFRIFEVPRSKIGDYDSYFGSTFFSPESMRIQEPGVRSQNNHGIVFLLYSVF